MTTRIIKKKKEIIIDPAFILQHAIQIQNSMQQYYDRKPDAEINSAITMMSSIIRILNTTK